MPPHKTRVPFALSAANKFGYHTATRRDAAAVAVAASVVGRCKDVIIERWCGADFCAHVAPNIICVGLISSLVLCVMCALCFVCVCVFGAA